MNPLVRQQPRFAAALIAAGVVASASIVSVPTHREVPTISADVVYTSAVTNALLDFGQGVEVANALVGIHVDAVISLPFEATLALMAAAQYPELSPNILSFLVQRFVNPAVGDPIHAYPYDTELAVARLADLLPYPLGPSATQPGLILEGGRIFAEVFNSVLGRLPDPLPGYDAVQSVMTDTVLGGVVVAAHLLTRAPMNMAWNTANYLGYLPAYIEATVEAAIESPEKLPGLISNLAYGLLSPDAQVGLFGKLLNNAVDPFTWLPAPIGYTSDATQGGANLARDVISSAANGFLSALPEPVRPPALPPDAGPVLGPRGGLSSAKEDENASDTTALTLDTATDDDQSNTPVDDEPVTVEPVTVEPVTVEPVKTEPVTSKPVKSEPVTSKPVKSEPVKTEPVKRVKSDLLNRVKTELLKRVKREPVKTEPAKSEPAKSEPGDSTDAKKSESTGDAA